MNRTAPADGVADAVAALCHAARGWGKRPGVVRSPFFLGGGGDLLGSIAYLFLTCLFHTSLSLRTVS